MHSKGERRAFQSRDILLGLAAGLVVALGLYFAGHGRWHGLHAGTVGVAVNYLTVLASRAARRPSQAGERRNSLVQPSERWL
jgi:hypothetical protein